MHTVAFILAAASIKKALSVPYPPSQSDYNQVRKAQQLVLGSFSPSTQNWEKTVVASNDGVSAVIQNVIRSTDTPKEYLRTRKTHSCAGQHANRGTVAAWLAGFSWSNISRASKAPELRTVQKRSVNERHAKLLKRSEPLDRLNARDLENVKISAREVMDRLSGQGQMPKWCEIICMVIDVVLHGKGSGDCTNICDDNNNDPDAKALRLQYSRLSLELSSGHGTGIAPPQRRSREQVRDPTLERWREQMREQQLRSRERRRAQMREQQLRERGREQMREEQRRRERRREQMRERIRRGQATEDEMRRWARRNNRGTGENDGGSQPGDDSPQGNGPQGSGPQGSGPQGSGPNGNPNPGFTFDAQKPAAAIPGELATIFTGATTITASAAAAAAARLWNKVGGIAEGAAALLDKTGAVSGAMNQ